MKVNIRPLLLRHHILVLENDVVTHSYFVLFVSVWWGLDLGLVDQPFDDLLGAVGLWKSELFDSAPSFRAFLV